ncbi:patatin-like phospholipase family protein [Bradyrhizobium sp. 190]|uniref:patatin-like phospholipase family protein n=1 Tax=Bradyrhizobium sp. 190 TaxID=2782658 RepID=UPI001FF973C0|nr:patatin-like phospholipase family protein [Bradyrhizobium sp. 190]MCK1516385.1 patatin-like phospholipase family protein [Bradyrhizobium sp. 190]
MADQVSRYGKPEKTCDIVMKGGITSGVVYPLALAALAEKYRFSNIGGTSAGAIAAAAAAAAEYGRHTPGGGFDRLAKIPNEVGPGLLSMFQPAPPLKPLFNIFIAALKSGSGRRFAMIWSAIRGYWLSALFGLAPGVAVVAAAWWYGNGIGFMAFGALLAFIGLVVVIVRRLLRAAQVELPASDFGLCPGISQPYSSSEGFTDWLARLINEAAGRTTTDEPLTFGDLSAKHDGRPAIRLAMVTTSLMEQRPYTLPFPESDHRFVFAKSEWARIFPRWIMEFLTRKCTPLEEQAEGSVEYYYFPDPTRLPLIVGARMSLSFPFLISAVPLWRRDFTLVDAAEQQKLRRCLFSDGGLSSNFPIHFFDRLLPNNPTFAISLDDYYEKRSQGRPPVWLPKSARSGILLPVQPIDGLSGFAMRLVMSAKDWQDNMQSTLPGYRERIAHVVLKPEQGGLNLTMDEATIRQLVQFGEQAGEKLRDEFDLDAHRWRRFLVAMARMEETLDDVEQAHQDLPDGSEGFARFLARYGAVATSYKQDPPRLAEMIKRAAELAACGENWRAKPTIREGTLPKPGANLRITPKY